MVLFHRFVHDKFILFKRKVASMTAPEELMPEELTIYVSTVHTPNISYERLVFERPNQSPPAKFAKYRRADLLPSAEIEKVREALNMQAKQQWFGNFEQWKKRVSAAKHALAILDKISKGGK